MPRFTPLRVSRASRWLSVHDSEPVSRSSGRVTRTLSFLAASPRVSRMLRRLRVPRQKLAALASRRVHRRPPLLSSANAPKSIEDTPRWPRPASPRRVNDIGSVVGPKHLSLSPLVRPLRWGRARRSWLPDPRTGTLESPSGSERFYSVLVSTGPGCFHDLGPDPLGSMLTPLRRGSPRVGLV